jgi:adenylate kinase family enzyme
MPEQQAYIFIGRSGSGKGTQAARLQKMLHEKNPEQKVIYEETGAFFRNFIEEDHYSARLSKEIMNTGARQPSFLAVLMWGNILLKNLTGSESIIIDGSPRALPEAHILDSALSFYKLSPKVIYINISFDEAIKRLRERGRADDKNIEEVKERLAWFDRDVVPAIEYYRTNPAYTFVEVNGEEPVDVVFEKLAKSLNI